MDASKLANVIVDLNFPSNTTEVTDLLQTLVDSIRNNDSVQITSIEAKLERVLSDSVVNNYSPSNYNILEHIGGVDYFGNLAETNIKKILSENTYDVQKTIEKLEKYIANRAEFLTVIDIAKTTLKKINIKPHYNDDSTFEIGLLMPDKPAFNKIVNLTKELNKWDKVIKTFKELTEGETEDTEINFLSNGSLQFFIDNSPEVAICISVIVERISKLYKNLIEIKEAREKLKKLGVTTGDTKSIEKQEKDIFNKEIDKISTDLVRDFAQKNIESGRLNELKIAVKGNVIYIAKCIDNGLIIEITPPEADEDAVVKEVKSDEENAKKLYYEKVLNQIEVVRKSMSIVKEIGTTAVNITKYLSNPEDVDQEDLTQ